MQEYTTGPPAKDQGRHCDEIEQECHDDQDSQYEVGSCGGAHFCGSDGNAGVNAKHNQVEHNGTHDENGIRPAAVAKFVDNMIVDLL